jgi:hypothetical protein
MIFDKLPDFSLQNGEVSRWFSLRGVHTFHEACRHVWKLPYRRPSTRDLEAVLKEGCGTCSSKHALLSALAQSHQVPVELRLVLFEMNSLTHSVLAPILTITDVDTIPEAHCLLAYDNEQWDVTFPDKDPRDMTLEIIFEKSLDPEQLHMKEEIHRSWMRQWLQTTEIDMTFDRLWEIREACIARLTEVSGP